MRSSLVGLAFLCLLPACGGGGGGGASPTTTTAANLPLDPPPSATPSITYQALTSTASVTSDLRGKAIRTNGSTGALTVRTTTGTLAHNTGATTVSDGTYTLTDPDGPDGNGVVTDGSAVVTQNGTQGFQASYEYAGPYTQSYTSGGTAYNSSGISGVATLPVDVPTSGGAVYVGEAEATVITASQGIDLKNGTSTVEVNFGSGRVKATLNGFTATDQATGTPITAPIDTITADGMAISGNSFTGGAVTTSRNGAAVSVTGAGSQTNAQGNLYGYDTGLSAPDEVGGVVLITGPDGVVTGTYIAD